MGQTKNIIKYLFVVLVFIASFFAFTRYSHLDIKILMARSKESSGRTNSSNLFRQPDDKFSPYKSTENQRKYIYKLKQPFISPGKLSHNIRIEFTQKGNGYAIINSDSDKKELFYFADENSEPKEIGLPFNLFSSVDSISINPSANKFCVAGMVVSPDIINSVFIYDFDSNKNGLCIYQIKQNITDNLFQTPATWGFINDDLLFSINEISEKTKKDEFEKPYFSYEVSFFDLITSTTRSVVKLSQEDLQNLLKVPATSSIKIESARLFSDGNLVFALKELPSHLEQKGAKGIAIFNLNEFKGLKLVSTDADYFIQDLSNPDTDNMILWKNETLTRVKDGKQVSSRHWPKPPIAIDSVKQRVYFLRPEESGSIQIYYLVEPFEE